MASRNEQMELLRGQYEEIKVPAVLGEKLAQMMEEKKRQPVVYPWGRYFVRTLLAAAVALTVVTNVSAAAAEALGKVPVIGAFTKLVTFRTYTDEQKGMEAKIEVPHVEGLGDAAMEQQLNTVFERYADTLIAQYEADLAAFGQQGGHESITSTYDVPVQNERQLTVAIHTTITQASGLQLNAYYTIDKNTGSIVQLKDLFLPDAAYIEPISAEIIRQMKQQMEADGNKVYFVESSDTADFKNIAADQSFYVDGHGTLVISFDEYEVAPGYMGAVSFTIPPQVVASIRAENSLLAAA